MKKTILAPSVPTANIAVNKSRIKLYDNAGEMPTYYLQKGQEFQIELFNPTTSVVLAKIILNGNAISQGGLILNPGQRVFLDRYLDVAKKFLFDTYEIENSEEAKEAIQNNGDFKVEFYRESKPVYTPQYRDNFYYNNRNVGGFLNGQMNGRKLRSSSGNPTLGNSTTSSSGTIYGSSSISGNINCCNDSLLSNSTALYSSPSLDFDAPLMDLTLASTKSIETGRVEEGSYSDQKFKSVNKSFDYSPFHTIEYKMLPVSQKVNTVEDLQVKVYCTNCGSKLGKTDKFCAKCGTKR